MSCFEDSVRVPLLIHAPGRIVAAEYAAEGAVAPLVMLRKGRMKLV